METWLRPVSGTSFFYRWILRPKILTHANFQDEATGRSQSNRGTKVPKKWDRKRAKIQIVQSTNVLTVQKKVLKCTCDGADMFSLQ